MSVEIISAIGAAIVSVVTAIGAIIISFNIRRDSEKKDVQLKEIHTLVNSRLTEALNEIVELRSYISRVLQSPRVDSPSLPIPPAGNKTET